MKEEIFRKKSLDKIKSPESLDDYIKVSNPGVWLLLAGVVVLLVGACVWGIFGHIDSTLPVNVRVENGEAVCFITEENISDVKVGTKIKLEDGEAFISEIGEKQYDGYRCALSADFSLADGFYDGKAVLKSYTPMSFILN